QFRVVSGPAQAGHCGVKQRTGRLRDRLEHLAVQGAQALANLPDAAPAPTQGQQFHGVNVARCGDLQSCLNLYLTPQFDTPEDGSMRRLLTALCAAAVCLTGAPAAHAEYTPWFAQQVGDATQVISVVGAGGSSAKVDVFQRDASGWQPLRAGIPAHVGANGFA